MSNTKKESCNLSDTAIAQIVQLIQLGILTGTDVSDQMRTLRLIQKDDNSLIPCPDYMSIFNENLEKMKALGTDE
jgi:hypothetical protein